MIFKPITKLDKRNTAKPKNDDIISENCGVIVFFFQIYGQFAAIQKPDSRHTWSKKLTFSLTVTFHLTKFENRTKKSLTQFSSTVLTVLFE